MFKILFMLLGSSAIAGSIYIGLPQGNVQQQTAVCGTVFGSVIDWTRGNCFQTNVANSGTTFVFSNAVSGQNITVKVASTTTSITWPTTKWPAGTAPTQTANGTDITTFIFDGVNYYGSSVQDLR